MFERKLSREQQERANTLLAEAWRSPVCALQLFLGHFGRALVVGRPTPTHSRASFARAYSPEGRVDDDVGYFSLGLAGEVICA